MKNNAQVGPLVPSTFLWFWKKYFYTKKLIHDRQQLNSKIQLWAFCNFLIIFLELTNNFGVSFSLVRNFDGMRENKKDLFIPSLHRLRKNKWKQNPSLNPHWHELWKQEKCSSLAPPRDIFYKTQWALQINPIYVNFHLQKSLEIFDKKSADKIDPKSTRR